MISSEELVLRLGVAAVLGGLVGLERERLEWAAGMGPTHSSRWAQQCSWWSRSSGSPTSSTSAT
jgi:hypothetical protein